ncbi:hypothetical protein HUW76_03360 [Fusobacterium animalis]|uniref:Phage head morphogenesis domain-containing protein n=1 Tax=Fusobacterium animalis 4_8 TaxID=469607 RepID=R9RAC8_9FUSO|nr:hypothetical protein [Fusobacterium animalis]AGM23109.1 hypothetical protein HMPREF0409_01082 [Fusobacterium animalis 4_8]DAX86238.1 MAG TPA: minor capsid component [Caudoviricetes sp.]
MKKEVKKIRTLKLLEKRLTARNKKIIDKIFNEFKEKIVVDNASKNDLKIIIDIDYEWLRRKIKSGLETLYTFTFESTLKSFQNIYNKKIKSNTMKGIKDYFLKKWNKKNAAKQATRISKTTQIKLNKIITTGQEEGISHNEMVEKIVKEVNGMSAQRASTIARTETSKSINATSFETAKGIMKEKCWIHVGGKKMYRIHHKAISGKWVDINYKWKLENGVEALYPHEDGLPASEVVRCSCLIIFR